MPDPGEPAGFNHNTNGFPVHALTKLQASPGVRARLTTELATSRAELGRVDAKINTLLAVCGVLLAGGVNVLGKAGFPGVAAAVGWAGTALVAAAVVLLLLAIRPNLTGSFGFMRWAAAGDGQGVLDDLGTGDALTGDAAALHGLAVMLRAKYQTIQHASTLVIVGLGAGAITAVLAVWAR